MGKRFLEVPIFYLGYYIVR